MPPHVLVHYHRLRHDYHAFHLVVHLPRRPDGPTVFAQARPHTLTSFGALFRVDLSQLGPLTSAESLVLLPVRYPHLAHLLQVDAPRRTLPVPPSHPQLHHAFIVQGDARVCDSPLHFRLPAPFQPFSRFLYFTFDLATLHPSFPIPALHLYVSFTGAASAHSTPTPPFSHTTVFPASPLATPPRERSAHTLFILDLFALYTLPALLIPVLVLHPKQFHPPPPSPFPLPSTAPLNAPCKDHVFQISVDSPNSSRSVAVPCTPLPDMNSPDVTELIRAQALANPALSPLSFIDCHSSPALSLLLPHFQRSNSPPLSTSFPNPFDNNALIVYMMDAHALHEKDARPVNPADDPATNGEHITSDPILHVKNVAGASSIAKRISPTSRPSPVFHVDLPSLFEKASPNTLSLTARHTLAADPSETRHVEWTSTQGPHVIIEPTFPRLLTPPEVDIRLYYHRYDQFADWKRWRLHLSSADHSITLCPHRPHRPGVVFFNLKSTVFPYEATVRADLFRISPVAENIMTKVTAGMNSSDAVNLDIVDRTIAGDFADVDRRDVPREWKSGQSLHEMHLIQGDPTVHGSPLARDIMEKTRFVHIRYRRFLPGDYDGWDLWTWDDADVPSNRISVKPCNAQNGLGVAQKHQHTTNERQCQEKQPKPPRPENRAWVDFVIDRAQYGAGANVSLLPRRGDDKWLERDYPVRVIKANEVFWTTATCQAVVEERGLVAANSSAVFTKPSEVSQEDELFIITQGTDILTRDLAKEVHSSLQVYVESNSTSSVILQTPVPIAWVSPPSQTKSNAVQQTTFRFYEEDGLQNGNKSMQQTRLLRFRKVHKESPTMVRVYFNSSDVVFDEDFLVENVKVSVPGFEDKILKWQTLTDWDAYLYEGALGWEYKPNQCSFRCFSPTADKVSVVLYDRAVEDHGRLVIPMRRIPHGCWKSVVEGDLKGKYYKLLADGENKRLFPGVEVIDPYSRCNTAHNGRGFIYGIENTPIAPRPDIEPNETIVYELHVRDVTVDENSGIRKRGKFAGLCERGTSMTLLSKEVEKERESNKSNVLSHGVMSVVPSVLMDDGVNVGVQRLNKISTGLDHIVQMGVNTVQILPLQDFDNDESDDTAYRWGYMPVHFNSPDGWYASRTSDAARVTEMKQMVDALHKAGLRVIMDVVYNHTAEDSNEFNMGARFSFNGLAPRYYYRTCGNTPVAHNGDTTCGMRAPDEPRCGECYSNGSGCGNEFRSEAPMARKFVIDSLTYWVREYGVDGFRFDLMGLMDIDTLTLAARELHGIDPSIMVYGEPWAGGLTPIRVTNKGTQRSRGFGVFNDDLRNAIRGSPFESEENFVMDGGRTSAVKAGIIGSIDTFCDAPIESINYVECHDNYTLWDHFRFYIRSRSDDIVFSEDDLRRMHRLAAVIVFIAQGVPFIQAGQEMCRTKHDVENSYESPDSINRIDWHRKCYEWVTVLYYRGLILLRRSNPHLFCKHTAQEIHDSVIFYEDLSLPVPDRCIAFRITGDQEAFFKRRRHHKPQASLDNEKELAAQWTQVVVLLNPTPTQVKFHLPEADKNVIWFQVVDAKCAGLSNLRGPAIASVSVEGRSSAVLRRASEKETIDAQLLLRLDAISDSYCSFHGDDSLSRYAVGLHQIPSPEEADEQRRLAEQRCLFEQHQASSKE